MGVIIGIAIIWLIYMVATKDIRAEKIAEKNKKQEEERTKMRGSTATFAIRQAVVNDFTGDGKGLKLLRDSNTRSMQLCIDRKKIWFNRYLIRPLPVEQGPVRSFVSYEVLCFSQLGLEDIPSTAMQDELGKMIIEELSKLDSVTVNGKDLYPAMKSW